MGQRLSTGQRRSGDRGLTIVLGIQIATLFVAAPLAATGVWPVQVVDLLRLGLAATAVLLVTRTWTSRLFVVSAFLVSTVLAFARRNGGSALGVELEHIAAAAAFDFCILVVVARSVFLGREVNVHRIMGAVIVYISIGLVFANAYRACALLLHPSFSVPLDGRGALGQMLYFSLSTLTTTGFGDIAPVHPFVRSLANLESVIGQLYPATLLARLVTLHVTEQAGRNDAER